MVEVKVRFEDLKEVKQLIRILDVQQGLLEDYEFNFGFSVYDLVPLLDDIKNQLKEALNG